VLQEISENGGKALTKRALISVSDKSGVVDLAESCTNWALRSSPRENEKALEEAGLP